ncbi:hypothetical protein FSARC_14211 [Fusarium sarcochroum]|uniref:Monooxygenase n=1 Tax=Fusarium sarcochroum TaxID=1208366 RepID=A0A8H4WQC1_9HYPO|nr:hypothetical protein FSARC_14211 [Fusarium sarcochroum]
MPNQPNLNEVPTAFCLKDTPVENQRSLRVIIIGAGFSGIYTTIRITQKLRNIDLTVYDMNDAVSGVWWLNRYPGLACDIPFSRQTHIGHPYTLQGQKSVPICKMLLHVTVRDLKTDDEFEDTADVVISARGGLNQIYWPKIAGIEGFKGKLMHSGAWDESYDARNQKIGVIGNGSSAIQIVPSLQCLEGTQLWCFARSPTWIAASFGDMAMRKIGRDPKDTQFSKRHQEYMARHPEEFHRIRKTLENEAAKLFPVTLKGSEESNMVQTAIEGDMRRRLGNKSDITDALLPKFAPGCRRLTPGPNYLEALQEDNVHFTNAPIRNITPRGIEMASGEHIDLDLLVCATGYDVEAPPLFELVGRDGMSLSERWQPYAEAYLGVAVDSFPNFLLVGGPNSGLGSGSLISVFEAQGDYAVKMLRKMQKEDYATFEVKSNRVADFSQYIDEEIWVAYSGFVARILKSLPRGIARPEMGRLSLGVGEFEWKLTEMVG